MGINPCFTFSFFFFSSSFHASAPIGFCSSSRVRGGGEKMLVGEDLSHRDLEEGIYIYIFFFLIRGAVSPRGWRKRSLFFPLSLLAAWPRCSAVRRTCTAKPVGSWSPRSLTRGWKSKPQESERTRKITKREELRRTTLKIADKFLGSSSSCSCIDLTLIHISVFESRTPGGPSPSRWPLGGAHGTAE